MAKVFLMNILLCFSTEIFSGVNGRTLEIPDTFKVDPSISGYGGLPGIEIPIQNWGESLGSSRKHSENRNFLKGIQRRNRMSLPAEGKLRKRLLYGIPEERNDYDNWLSLYNGGITNGRDSFRNRRLRQQRRYLEDRMTGAFISNRILFFPDEERRSQRKKPHNYRNRFSLRKSILSKPFQSSRSVRMFKKMKNKLYRSRTMNKNRQIPDVRNVDITNEIVRTPNWQYRCKTGTAGVFGVRNGRIVSSRGLTFSEDDGNGVKSLICKAETTEMSKPDDDTFLKYSVTGLKVVTTDTDPFRFLEHNSEINNDKLEIGSKSSSALESVSHKNKSVSAVSVQDRDAESQTKVSTKFVYENSARKAFESRSDVEGSARFNITNGQAPLVLTGKQESSSLVKNSKERFSEGKNDKTVTFMNYKKKTDFDIAFRNLFDY